MLKEIYNQFADIRKEEWPKALLLSAFFFLVIAIFWILKPIKRGLMLDFYGAERFLLFGFELGGAEAEQVGKVINMVVAYGVVIVFTLLVRHLKRQQVVYVFCAGLSAIVATFAFLITSPGAPTVWTFYVFGDIFNTIMVATFWAFTNDVNLPEQSKRLYFLIGLGGVVGGFVGATVVTSQVEAVGRQPLLLACIVALVVIAAIAWYVNRISPRPKTTEDAASERPTTSAAVEGARITFSSKYLLAILGIIGLYELVSNIVDYQLAKEIQMAVEGGLNYDEQFGFVGQLIGIVSIVVQLFLTGVVMRRYGLGVALLFLPAAILLGSTGFLIFPVLGLAIAMSVSDNSLNYSINQSAKEALYTVTSADAKYKAKAFIDMFVQRFAKVIAVVLNLSFAAFIGAAGVRWLSLVSIGILVGWILIVRFAGRRFKELEEEEALVGEEAATA